MPPKRRAHRFPIYNQINLTNMIDMLFFLLIVFLMDLHLLKNCGDVTPPELNADPIKSDAETRVINIKLDGSIVFDHRIISETELRSILSQIKQEKGIDTEIYLRGDKDAYYGEVMDVMNLVKNAGFRSVSLVTQAEDIK